jgi:integrase
METKRNKNGITQYRDMITIEGRTFKSPWSIRVTDAKKWKAQKVSEREKSKLSGRGYFVQDKILFSDYAQQWLKIKIIPNKTASTAYSYESMIRVHCLPVVGQKPVHEIGIKEANLILMNLRAKGNNAQGINHIITVLKQILKDAEREGVIERSGLTHLKRLKVSDNVWAYWEEMEINRFFLKIKALPLYPLFATAIYTGMRRGELSGLKWDCVDFARNQLIVKRVRDRNGLRDTTKTGKSRLVPINPSLYPILLKLWQNRSDDTQLVFTKEDGGDLNAHHLGRDFDSYQASVEGLKRIRFHDLRHTFASQFVMKGGNIYTLREILGHTDVKMTQRYAHLSPEHLRGATDFLSFDSLKSEPNPNLTRFDLKQVQSVNVLNVSG